MSTGWGEHRSVEELESEEEEEEDGEEKADSEEEKDPRSVTPPRPDPRGALLVASNSPEKEDSLHWLFILAVVIGAIMTLRFVYLCLMWSIMTF